MENVLTDRTKGKFPISIGTSLAIECFFGVCDDKPLPSGEIPPFRYYDCLSINVRTLIRNIVNTLPSSEHIKLSKNELYNTLLSEISLINEIVLEESKGSVYPTFYVSTYKRLPKVFKKMHSKEAFTDKQRIVKNFEDNVAEFLYHSELPLQQISLEKTELKIRYGRKKNLMLTHYPVDLLLTPFNKLDLLESHTGTIKNSFLFNTKLKGKPEFIPFNRYTIQIYGDTTGMFLPADTQIRNDIARLVEEKYINQLMSEDKFLYIVKKHASKETVMFVKSAI